MKNETPYILMGLFVLTLGTALIAGVLWLGTGGSGRDYPLYTVYMAESVAGLSRDGAVKYRGVNVGRIRAIGLAPNNPELVELVLEIEPGTPIKQDTVATLEAQGLTGLAYINLLGGSQAAPPLTAQRGEPYPVIRSRPSIWGRLDQSVGELVDNLIEASKRLKALLSPDNQQLVVDSLTNLSQLAQMLAHQSPNFAAAIDDLTATLRNTRDASISLPTLMQQLQRSAEALEAMAGQIAKTGSALRDTVAARDNELQRFTGSALPEAAVMVQELRQTAENFRRLSESLQRNPAILLRGTPAPPPGPGE